MEWRKTHDLPVRRELGLTTGTRGYGQTMGTKRIHRKKRLPTR